MYISEPPNENIQNVSKTTSNDLVICIITVKKHLILKLLTENFNNT